MKPGEIFELAITIIAGLYGLQLGGKFARNMKAPKA